MRASPIKIALRAMARPTSRISSADTRQNMRFARGNQNVDKIQQLADYIDQSHSMVAITGAGISLAGGGITYSQLSKTVRQSRPNAQRFSNGRLDLPPSEGEGADRPVDDRLAPTEAERRAIPQGGFGSDDFLRSYVKAMHSYKPSFSHYALRDLEAAGKLKGIITTNEDCMHTMAGSKNVAEIQGGFQVNRCSK